MYYILIGHDKSYIVESMIQTFYPNQTHIKLELHNYNINFKYTYLKSVIENGVVYALLYKYGYLVDKEAIQLTTNKEINIRREIKYTIYNLLKRETKLNIPWGLLTGIRPAKMVRELKESGLTYDKIESCLIDFYCVDKEKANLAITVAKKEFNIIKDNNGNDMSIYIGIPFCPSKCLYCSFTSYPLTKYQNRIEEYLISLTKEIEYGKVYSSNRNIESIYIGGGTPTSISSTQLEKLLYSIYENLNLNNLKEFTVEAGRPDTLNLEKLKVLKKYNVTRISINPQTMNEKTLSLIGRNHSVEEFKHIYNLARDLGFNNINVDLILGLIGENLKDVEYTMEEILRINPENITAHTLAIKRASKLKEEINNYIFASEEEVEQMLKVVKQYTEVIGMEPYYLYRQKNMVGNFENVGYSKQGFEGIYNVQIMEERQDILALGAGASSKFIDLKTNKINRVFNVKNVDDYINKIDDMIMRKETMEEILC